jgi:hypothetical protein
MQSTVLPYLRLGPNSGSNHHPILRLKRSIHSARSSRRIAQSHFVSMLRCSSYHITRTALHPHQQSTTLDAARKPACYVKLFSVLYRTQLPREGGMVFATLLGVCHARDQRRRRLLSNLWRSTSCVVSGQSFSIWQKAAKFTFLQTFRNLASFRTCRHLPWMTGNGKSRTLSSIEPRRQHVGARIKLGGSLFHCICTTIEVHKLTNVITGQGLLYPCSRHIARLSRLSRQIRALCAKPSQLNGVRSARVATIAPRNAREATSLVTDCSASSFLPSLTGPPQSTSEQSSSQLTE